MKKRGQVTIFVIVGILILIIVSMFYFLLRPESLERGEVLEDQVPSEFSPVKNYVDSCIRSIGEDGLKIMGERGGYIFNDEYLFSPSVVGLFPSSDDATAGNAFYSHTSGRVPIPYWFYLESPNEIDTFSFSSMMPKLNSIEDKGEDRDFSDMSVEAQLDRYISMNLDGCLNDFQVFDKQGFVVEPVNSVPIVTTYAGENVIINVEYPLRINVGSKTTEIKRFGQVLELNMVEIFDLAEKLVSLQADYHFLEKHILTMMVVNDMADSESLPPMDDFTFNFGDQGQTWQVSQIKDNLKHILTYTQLIQVEGSRNYDPIIASADQYETRQKMYDNMVLAFTDYYTPEEYGLLNLDGKDVEFMYFEDWPIYMNVNDDGGVVKPKVVGLDLGMFQFGFQQYETLYDLSWPVLIKFKVPEGLGGKGYVFQFGLEANIRDNLPLNASYSPLRFGSDNLNICDHKEKNITVEVYDNNCNPDCRPLSGASVTLMVGDESCLLGITDANGTLKTKVPTGILGGQIKATKMDYLGESVEFSPRAEGYVLRGLRNKYLVNISVKKLPLKKIGGAWQKSGEILDLEDEDAIVRMSRIAGVAEDSFSVSASLGQETYFVSGLYEIDGMLFESQNSSQKAKLLVGLRNLSDQGILSGDQIDLVSQSMITSEGNMPVGGVRFGYDGAGLGNPIRFTETQLRNASKIIIYMVEFEDVDMSDADDVLILGELHEITSRYQDELVPEIK